MPYRYVVADVFTRHAYGGNPLAVVLDAQGLDTAQMQRIAREFNSPRPASCCRRAIRRTAEVRIFTPDREVPFAGHPNVGTAVVLARELAASGRPVPDAFVFEEAAGLVRIALRREGADVNGAELQAPQPLSRRALAPVDAVARALRRRPGTSRRPSTRRKSCRSA